MAWLPGLYFGFQADYLSDRLVRVYSVLLFLILSLYLATELRGNNAMNCWTPAQFTSAHNAYTNRVCLLSSTLYVPRDDMRPDLPDDEPKTITSVSKFKLMPALLFLQSLVFILPWLMWKTVSNLGYNLDGAIKGSDKEQCTSISILSNPVSSQSFLAGGYILPGLYLLLKVLNFIVCLVQMGIISGFFYFNFFTYKSEQSLWEPLTMTGNENSTTVESPFPRIALCSFEMRYMARIHSYTVQCAVGISESVEQCLTVIWIWLIIVLLLTTLSGVYSLLQYLLWFLAPMAYSKSFVTKRLGNGESVSSEVLAKFCKQFMKPDVFFVVNMAEENGSLESGCQIVKGLWGKFLKESKIHVESEVEVVTKGSLEE